MNQILVYGDSLSWGSFRELAADSRLQIVGRE